MDGEEAAKAMAMATAKEVMGSDLGRDPGAESSSANGRGETVGSTVWNEGRVKVAGIVRRPVMPLPGDARRVVVGDACSATVTAT